MHPNRISSPPIMKMRPAFTLVELMVAMALIILMLSIMSQAFVIATGTMQGLKELADMQEKIRPAMTLLQRDLGAYHFEGSKKLSDPEFWDNGPPKEGYFMLWQDNANDVSEPVINNNGPTFSRSAAAANHMIAFTVKLPGKNPSDFFESGLGANFSNLFYNTVITPLGMKDANIRRFENNANLIHSDWAEVAYFLGPHTSAAVAPDGNTDGKSSAALPFYNLYRQQRLVLPSYNIAGVNLPTPVDDTPNYFNRDKYSELSFHPGEYLVPATSPPTPVLKFNSPKDLTVPWKRMGNRTFSGLNSNHYLGKPQPNKPLFSEFLNTSSKVNTDIIATNVISFDVKLLADDLYEYKDLFAIGKLLPYKNHDAVYNYSNPPPPNTKPFTFDKAVFDTWTTDQGNSANTIPKYDFGVYDNFKWSPYTSTQDYTKKSSTDNANTIPFWNWTNNTGLNIKAIQISLRVWDQKSNSAKMFVIVQKL